MTDPNDSSAPQQADQAPPAPPQDEAAPPVPPQGPQGMAYARKPKSKGLAVAALILGICAMIVPGLGLLAGLMAVVFGVLALAKKTPGTAMAAVGLVLGIIGPIGQIAIGLHLVGGAREDARRAVCAAHLNGMGKAVAMWHAENNDKWMDLYSEADIALPDSPGSDWGKADASSAATLADLDPDCNAQHWWLLCDAGTIAEAGFTCPSDPQDALTPQHAGGKTKGFGSWANVSYGLQPMLNEPLANPGRPGNTSQDGEMILAGDRPRLINGVPQLSQPNANHGTEEMNALKLNLSVKRIDWNATTANRLGHKGNNIYMADGTGEGTVTRYVNDTYLMYRQQDPEPEDE